ncbi:F0F1 ATP synthase subunit A [bacterium]|nr:F0F1 ATP synthase subunit A [bacterium]
MKGFDLFGGPEWKPLSRMGFTHKFFNLNYETLVHTWTILGLLFVLLVILNWFLKKKNSTLQFIALSFVNYFKNLCDQTLGTFSLKHFTFITTIFCFIFSSNLFAIIPGIEEPTSDINTTLALGIISFLYTQFYAIKANGLWAYIKEYFSPFFLMLPLNIVGKIATVISLSFRLFGNIFGGLIIAKIFLMSIEGSIVAETIGTLCGVDLVITLFFGLFEGFLQAFVFAMLTLTYLSIALQGEGGH